MTASDATWVLCVVLNYRAPVTEGRGCVMIAPPTTQEECMREGRDWGERARAWERRSGLVGGPLGMCIRYPQDVEGFMHRVDIIGKNRREP